MGKTYGSGWFDMKPNVELLKQGTFLVIGDLIVDEYEIGSVTRISPEAPIPVLDFTKSVRMPGGAANVAMNLVGLGNDVELVGIIGEDEAGNWLKNYLINNGVGTTGIIYADKRPTTKKVRFSTSQQTILRVDYENTNQVENALAIKIATFIEWHLQKNRIDGVLISDYNKGLIVNQLKNNPLLQIINNISHMPLLSGVDTKKSGIDLSMFENFTFIKPNQHELSKTVDVKINMNTNILQACRKYLDVSRTKSVLVTLGEEGMFHFNGKSGIHVPTVASSVYEVTGAGDTVFAVIMQSLLSGMSWNDSMCLANIAASAVIESRGTHFITKSELFRRLEIVRNTKPDYFNSKRSEG
jgi:D-beta-D-heptose 7-phosphate kinase/D-beta-D-heptose 1-phosphate adenosyltransferase